MSNVESLYKQLMEFHNNIDPKYYPPARNYKKYVKERLENSSLYEYKIGNQLVGIAFYYLYAKNRIKTLCITDLVIDEENRGVGHGIKLLKELHKIAKYNKCHNIQLMVSDKNFQAKSLYKSFGYKQVSIRLCKDLK